MKRDMIANRYNRIFFLASKLDRIEYSFAIFNKKYECGFMEHSYVAKNQDNIQNLLHRLSDKELAMLKRGIGRYGHITLNDLCTAQSFSFYFNEGPLPFLAIFKSTPIDYDVVVYS